MKNKFKIIRRDSYECEHDTGVFHSVGLGCDFVESMCQDLNMHEADPGHQGVWHNPKKVVVLD